MTVISPKGLMPDGPLVDSNKQSADDKARALTNIPKSLRRTRSTSRDIYKFTQRNVSVMKAQSLVISLSYSSPTK